MDARLRWAFGLGTLDVALFVGLLALLGLPAFVDPTPGVWGLLALLWVLAIVGAWLALRYAPDLPRVDSGAAIALVAMGTVVGAALGVITIMVLAVASRNTDPTMPAYAAFASLFAVFVGGAVGLACALIDVAVLALVGMVRRDRGVHG